MKKGNIKLTLKQSLVSLAAIPFIGFLLIIAVLVQFISLELKINADQADHADFIFSSATLLGSIQQERGLSATLINGGNTRDKVNALRKTVDTQYVDVATRVTRMHLFSKENNNFNTIKPQLNKLRSSVDAGTINFIDVMEKYSQLVDILINLNFIAYSEKSAGEVGKLLATINTLIDAQEGAGRLRGYSSSIVAANSPIEKSTLNTISFDYNIMALNIKKGLTLNKESQTELNKLLNSPELSRVTTYYYTISSKQQTGEFGLKSSDLWDDTTVLISYIQKIIKNQFTEVPKASIEIKKTFILRLEIVSLIAGLTIITVILLSFFLIRYISLRIKKVTNRLIMMSEGGGDLTKKLESDINDEIGQLSNAFNAYMQSLASLISEIKMLGTNFVSFSIELKKLITDINNSKSVVSESLLEVEDNTTREKKSIVSMKNEMDSVDSSTTTLSFAVEEQTTAVEESSAAVEEMLANINTVSMNVTRTADIVNDLSASGTEGKEQINRVTKEINTVSELSNSLKSANSLIADIADKTSLLSMNAAIEAAHAGDAGKGFAVVADEIRKLSESTASQSKGITENLNLIISAISTAVASSIETESTFSKITDKIEHVAQNQEQIKNAMLEQNQGSTEILEAVTMLKDNSSSVDETVSNLNSAGERMLKEESEVFKLLKNVGHSVKKMNSAVVDIDALLSTLTDNEEKNSKLVSDLSISMDLFKVD